VTDVAEGLGEFFDYRWGTDDGQVYLATLNKGGEFTQYMLPWPRTRKQIIQHVITQKAEGKDVYYCPALFVPVEKTVEFNAKGKTAATRDNVMSSRSLWIDIDGYKPNQSKPPENWSEFCKQKGIPEPTDIVQPSVADSQHVYWQLDKATPIGEVETINRSLAALTGADLSGWDGNQLLRIPYTDNHGYKDPLTRKEWFKGKPVEATYYRNYGADEVTPAQFSALAKAEQEIVERLQVTLKDIPTIESVMMDATWSKELQRQFSMTEDQARDSSPDKRSGALQKLAYCSAESSMTDEQMYSILEYTDRRWNVYVKRSPKIRHKLISDMIAKARAKIGYLGDDDLTFAGMLGGDEITEAPRIFYPWDEFLASDVEIDWLIEGLLSSTGYGVLTGQPGIGKTQVGIQIAISLALGHSNIFGWHVNGGARKGIMFSLEMDHAPLKYFAEIIQKNYVGQERAIGKNLGIVPLGVAIDILSPEGLLFFENLLKEHKPDFIFIDSLKKIMGKSLNDDEAIRKMNDVLAQLRKKYKCAIYVIHHDRKKQNGDSARDAGELSDMYGSQYIAAEADFALNFRTAGNPDDIYLSPWKIRLSRQTRQLKLRRSDLQFRVVEDEDDDDLIIVGQGPKSSDPDEEGPTLRT
jgi:hypothetical protein